MAKYLSQEQVKEVLDFSEAMYRAENYFSPFMSNQNLNDLNNNPLIPTSDALRKALSEYKSSAENLQSYMEFMQRFDIFFARTLQAYANILSFDLQIVCKNAFTQEEYESVEYEEDKKRVYKFLNSFDYKDEFRKVLLQVMRNETYYGWFRRTKWGNKGMKCTLQILPQKYCMTTGYWEKGILFDFDMGYFLKAGVDIDGFDPVFKKYRNRVFGEMEKSYQYDPTAPLNDRKGNYAFWTQTSPTDGAVCFKFDTTNFNNTPFLAPHMKDILTTEEIGRLQYDKDILSAYAILAGEIKLFDTAKSGTVADQFAIKPATLGTFMGKVKSGLDKRIKVVAMPLENVDMYQYNDTDKDMYANQLKNSAGSGLSASRLIYSSDRMSNAELQYATEADYHIMKNMYPQFEKFLDFWINKLTKKYKFHCILDGSTFEFERQARFDRLLKISDKGLVLNSSAYASVIGMAPQDFESSLTEGKYGSLNTKLSLLLNANTTKDGSVGGRPVLDDTKITDSGEGSRQDL